MKIYLAAAALSVMLVTSAAAGFAGSESRGQPVNSTVYVPAIDQDTGKMPTMKQRGSKAKAKKKSKIKRVY